AVRPEPVHGDARPASPGTRDSERRHGDSMRALAQPRERTSHAETDRPRIQVEPSVGRAVDAHPRPAEGGTSHRVPGDGRSGELIGGPGPTQMLEGVGAAEGSVGPYPPPVRLDRGTGVLDRSGSSKDRAHGGGRIPSAVYDRVRAGWIDLHDVRLPGNPWRRWPEPGLHHIAGGAVNGGPLPVEAPDRSRKGGSAPTDPFHHVAG